MLLFRHTQFPEAGLQVPGGTVKEGEDLETAVLREANEETGLTTLELVRYLGSQTWPIPERNETHQRHFYQLQCTTTPPETWLHGELDASDGSPHIEFEFFWAPLPLQNLHLAGEQGALLPQEW